MQKKNAHAEINYIQFREYEDKLTRIPRKIAEHTERTTNNRIRSKMNRNKSENDFHVSAVTEPTNRS